MIQQSDPLQERNMRKKKSSLTKITKETPETRKKRVSSGVKFRATVFNDKRKQLQDKWIKYKETL